MGRINNKRKGYYRIFPEDWKVVSVASVLKRVKDPVQVSPSAIYREIGIRSHGKGIFHKDEVLGSTLGNKSVFWVKPDCFVVNIVFAWELAVAKTTADEDRFIASHRFPMYVPIDGKLDLDFLLYYFTTPFGKRLLNLASPGGAGRNKTLGQSEFAKLKLCIPQKIQEQQKIAEILSTWDDAIRLQQELIEQKMTQKRGLMQLLLSGKIRVTEMGKLSPEAVKKRVADIQQGIVPEGYQKTKLGIIPSDWIIKSLGEIGVFSKGKGITNNQKVEKGLPCVTYGEIYTTHHFFIKTFSSFINKITAETSKSISKGDILFAGSGETLDEIGKCVAYLDDAEAYAGGDIIILSPNSTISSKYIAYLLNSDLMIKQRRKLGQGHSVVHIYSNSLKTLHFLNPPIPEQQQIADILTTADKEIELLETELDHLKQQKKGLMQLLLTGKIRVHEV